MNSSSLLLLSAPTIDIVPAAILPPSNSPIQCASTSPPDACPSSTLAATLPSSNPASALRTKNSPHAPALHLAAAPFSSSIQLLFRCGPNPQASASLSL